MLTVIIGDHTAFYIPTKISDLDGSLGLDQTPLTTAGDLLSVDSTPTLVRLPIGTAGQVMTVVGGVPAWAYLDQGTF